jgi:hydrophobe/amphiphile efflux-1 (HAE1) family protein
VPEEDQGYVFVAYGLMPGSSLKRTTAVTDTMVDRLRKTPEVANTITLNGFDILSTSQKSEAAITFVPLKPWSERKGENSDSFSLVKRIMGMGFDIKDGMAFAINPPPITGISITGGFEGYLQSRIGADAFAVGDAMNKIVAEAAKRPELAGVRTTLSVRSPQYFITLDREKAKALNVPVNVVFTTMQATFGAFYINDFTYSGRIFRVNMQSEADFREKPEDLRQVFVRSSDGNMISLDSLVTVKRTVGPDLVERFNGLPAAKITGNPAPGYSSGQALTAMEDVIAKTLPPADWTMGWTGAAYQEKSSGGTSGMAFVFGLIMAFLILAAQYERWTLPIAVLLTVPFAVFGAALAVWMRGLHNDVYFQVGLLTLIGLSAKNAILIVEFAVLEYQSGKSIAESAMNAAKLRFRPIIMTSLAFVLGCMPLVISSGAGAASRHSIGTGIVGGMIAATAIATLFVPLFFQAVMVLGEKVKNRNKPHAPHNPETHHDV